MYQPRTYRHWVRSQGLVSFNVTIKETDLSISARSNLATEARRRLAKYRRSLEEYIGLHPAFLTSLEPLSVDDDAPDIVKDMAAAAETVGVGPMAAVAGAIAEFVGRDLLPLSPEIIVENGGDIYLKSAGTRVVGIYAGASPLTGKIGLEINGEQTPLGICTSSGTVGHSLSLGQADAVIVIAPSAALADAAATAIGNRIVQPSDIAIGLEFAQVIDGLKGVVIIKGDQMGVWGEIKIAPIVS